MAQGSFPTTGSFAVTRPRTLREYRQAIFAGLKDLSNEDLVLLLALHFPEIHHVQDAQKNLINILLARLPVVEIWTRVNAFLALHQELPLEGEAPPPDLLNRSSRVLLAEPSSAGSPLAESMWSSDEITLPGALAQPAPRGTTATIPIPICEPISQPILPTPPALAGFAAAPAAPVARPHSWPAFGGLLLAVALLGVHVCPYVKHGVSPTKPERLVSLDSALIFPAALPRFTVIPATVPELSERPHTRHHHSQAAAGQSYDLTSEPECRFTRTRVVHGQLKDKVIKKKLPLPHGLKPGTGEAKDWLQKACERVQQNLPARR